MYNNYYYNQCIRDINFFFFFFFFDIYLYTLTQFINKQNDINFSNNYKTIYIFSKPQQ